jgi:creatinine amidohydrolase
VGVVDWWSLDPVISAEMTFDGSDVHANRGETSVMLAIAPELVHLDRLSTSDDPDRTGGLVFRYTAPGLSTNGVTGKPSLATAEIGERIVGRAVESISDLVLRARTEEPPLGRAFLPHLNRGADTWTP